MKYEESPVLELKGQITSEAIRQMLRESDGTAFDKARSVDQELTFTYAEKNFPGVADRL